jgi:di/tricarboxylate transporter
MQQNEKEVPIAGFLLLVAVLLNTIVLEKGYTAHSRWYLMLPFTLVLFAASIIFLKRRRR